MSSTLEEPLETHLGGGSDYGSDLGDDGEAQLSQLLEDIEFRRAAQPLVLESIEENETRRFAIVPAGSPSQIRKTIVPRPVSRATDSARPAVEVEYDDFVLDAFEALPQQHETFARARTASVEPKSDIPDTRTPLERFRTAPKKPLSVTDLISPAWCELQYWYTLTKFGKKRRTPAMKQGSVVHKRLEEEVHQTVPIDVQTREDTWGLRMWNIIQGLRTLRVTGMTREMEIWGVIDGQVVNGIIDELSFKSTDPELEARLTASDCKHAKEPEVPADQPTISQFFKPSGSGTKRNNTKVAKDASSAARKVYLTDVKTRATATVPAGASLRPTIMQLMIYRRLLSDLASNSVNADVIFARYRLNATERFSDGLISQLGSLDLNLRSDSTEDSYAPVESPVDTVVELLTHNSPRELWQLMIQEFQITIPHAVNSISRILRAEFRGQQDGKVIGAKTFVHDDAGLQSYVADEMSWWRGEREARGVEIEEAFKCRICEFAESCTWRNTKIEDAIQKSRARTTAHKKSEG